jgi:hypothetical protein
MEKNYLNWTAVSQHDARRQSNPRATTSPSLLLLILVLVFTFSATLTMAQFEVDGQSVHDTQEDWNDVFNGTSSATVTTGILPDGGGAVLSIPEDSYIGGGTKDDNDFGDWQWEFTGTSDKTDILHGGAALYGSRIFFFGDRYSNDGSTNIGFWFLQDEIELVPPAGNVKGQFIGSHQIGDILVVAEIEQGGVVGNASAYRWVGAGNGDVPQDTKSLETLDVDATNLFAIVNSNSITVPWQYQAKQPVPPNTIPPIAFFEGVIDLAALELTTNACFSSFIIETRASPEVSSILEDFLLGSFNVRPEVSLNNAQVCPGVGFTTQLTATVNGGVGPLSYEWTLPDGTKVVTSVPTLTASQVGTYSVVAIGKSVDGTGTCVSAPATGSVTAYPAPTVSALATPVSCVGLINGTIVATGSGGSGGGYQYKIGSGAFQASGTFTGLAPAVYTITVQDGNGCTGTTTATVLPANPLSVSAAPTPVTCNDGEGASNNGTINLTIISPGAGGLSFAWTRVGGGFNATTEDLSGLAAGTYNVLVTDSKGCTTTASATVLPATLLSVSALATPVRCNDQNGLSNDGTVALTINSAGAGGLTFAWTRVGGGFNAATEDLSGLAAGTYNVLVTDANGCTATASAIVQPAVLLSVSALATPVRCNDQNGLSNDGTINLTINSAGAGGLTFAWTRVGGGFNAATEDLSGLAAGTYNVLVTDSKGCTAVASAIVQPAVLLSASAVATPVTCVAGGPSNDGAINLTINSPGAGGLTFAWTRVGGGFNATTEDLSGLAAGTYNVVVTDSKGCTAVASAIVQSATLLSVSALATPVRCNDQNGLSNDGTVALTIISPGAGGLTFAWTRVGGGFNAATEDLSGLSAGTYNVLVTDSKGCTATASAIVQPAVLLSVSAIATPVRCNDRNGLSNDGTVALTIISPGAGGLTFAWTRTGGGFNAATEDLSGLAAGTYNVVVTDSKGCTAIASATVLPAVQLAVSAVATPVLCNNGTPSNDGTINLTINSPGAGGLTFAWTRQGGGFNAATEDLSGLAAGTYNVLVTDSKGCTAVASATVQPATLIQVSIIGTINCTLGPNGLPSGKVAVSGSGYSKLELYNATTNVKIAEQVTSAAYDFTGLASGSYYVIARAANSIGTANACSAQSPVAIVPNCYWFDIEKVTQGVVDPTRDWTFRIYNGPDGHGSGALASATTLGDADGILNFNYLNLDPTKTYTICEELMAAGWSAVWVTDVNGSSTVLMTYNPDGDKTPPEDLGNRCFDIGAGTAYPLIANGTFRISVDNTYPGGTARTPGYWKNWNRCTGGGQAANAARQGGWQNGYWLLEDVLANPGVTIGNLTVLTCADGVKILDQRDLKSNKKMASDAAYTLAMHLMAFKLNQAAGAYSCAAATDAAMKADALLISINYTGYGSYLKSSNPLYAKALKMAKLLDNYNNNQLDPTECSIISNFTVTEAEVAIPSGGGIITDNYPNPFETRTQIRFMVPERTHAVVQVMTMTGVQMKTLFDAEAEGNQWYEVEFDASSLSKQLYIYRIITDRGIVTGKLIQK